MIDTGKTLEQLGIQDYEKIKLKKGSDDFLLLFKDRGDHSFDFCCVEFYSSECNGKNISYEVLFSGKCYFDGVRHLYFGSEETDNYGYLYYQHVGNLVHALSVLDQLQLSKLPYYKKERDEELKND